MTSAERLRGRTVGQKLSRFTLSRQPCRTSATVVRVLEEVRSLKSGERKRNDRVQFIASRTFLDEGEFATGQLPNSAEIMTG